MSSSKRKYFFVAAGIRLRAGEASNALPGSALMIRFIEVGRLACESLFEVSEVPLIVLAGMPKGKRRVCLMPSIEPLPDDIALRALSRTASELILAKSRINEWI